MGTQGTSFMAFNSGTSFLTGAAAPPSYPFSPTATHAASVTTPVDSFTAMATPGGLHVMPSPGSDLVALARRVIATADVVPRGRIVFNAHDRKGIDDGTADGLRSLAEEYGMAICVKTSAPPYAVEFESADRVAEQLERGQMYAMHLSMYHQSEREECCATAIATAQLSLPAGGQPWSPLKALELGGADPIIFRLGRLDLRGLSYARRLEEIDKANEVFRYAYRSDGNRYFKIPISRGVNYDDAAGIKISRVAFENALITLEGAGPLQRIARAVPYFGIRRTILSYLRERGISLADVVIVGVDRGGRIPSLIVKHALGTPCTLFLKVDQGGGQLDEGRLARFERLGLFRNKFLLFIDSTVDSGRQIAVLERYLDGSKQAERFGHRGWVVAGSNENDQTLGPHHLNLDWGVDPDQTFEDDPRLIGFEYGKNYSHIESTHSPEARTIRRVFASVVHGVVIDASRVAINRYKRARSAAAVSIEEAEKRGRWDDAVARYAAAGKPRLFPDDYTIGSGGVERAPQRKLAIIGSIDNPNGQLTPEETHRIAAALAPHFTFNFGTDDGLPGMVMRDLAKSVPGSKYRLFLHEDSEHSGKGLTTIRTGEDLVRKRLNMMFNSDAVLVLAGGDGTLMEARMALWSGATVIAVRGYGAASIYIERGSFRQHRNLRFADSMAEAIELLKAIAVEAKW